MSGEAIGMGDWENEQFKQLLAGLPWPCPVYDDAAICPWCAAHHTTINFGNNECYDCHHKFWMGIPPWGSIIDERMETYAQLPLKEFEQLRGGSIHIPKFRPNECLKQHYKKFADIWPESYGKKRPTDATLN